MDNKNTGLDMEREIAEQSEKDWVFGANRKCLSEQLKQPLSTYLPKGEKQRGREDFMDCATRSPVNDLETKTTGLVFENLISKSNVKWLLDNGYFEMIDGSPSGITFSDRFPAILSGTTRNGNSLKAPVEAIRKYGMIPKSMLPASESMTWNEYHDKGKITGEMLQLGQEWLKRFSYNYEKVFDLLKIKDLVGVAGWAWPVPDKDGVYHRVNYRFNHAFLKLPDEPQIQIFDNYEDRNIKGDWIKQLAKDYKLMNYGYRSIVGEAWTEPIQPKKKLMLKTIKFKTDKNIYELDNVGKKELQKIGGYNTYLNGIERGRWEKFEELDDSLFPVYRIVGGELNVSYGLLSKILQALGHTK